MIILYCVREAGKLRIKFHSFINQQNERFTNVYNNNFNCMFPKEIREVGKYYRVPDADIRLANRVNGRPYYSIKRSNIVIMTAEEVRVLLNPLIAGVTGPAIRIFDAGECVVCISAPSLIAFIPCGHRCLCGACNIILKQTNYICPVCRERITGEIV
jgi:hypothetical protein